MSELALLAFDAVLVRPEGIGTWTYVPIPFDVCAAFGGKGQVKVCGSVNGHVYRGVAQPMGDGTHYLVVNQTIRDAIGAHAGATVRVVMERDTAARTVEMPPELRTALEHQPAARERYAALSYSHQREYVDWIAGAKKAETRERRSQAAIERLVRGERART
jgi:hypothetical protein